ncbi:hypothetical protein E2542_SST26268 [Spatholobus suberectus]|nr:hypothetical protein E2542_SST26268 [Spatholobus suberectus]
MAVVAGATAMVVGLRETTTIVVVAVVCLPPTVDDGYDDNGDNGGGRCGFKHSAPVHEIGTKLGEEKVDVDGTRLWSMKPLAYLRSSLSKRKN